MILELGWGGGFDSTGFGQGFTDGDISRLRKRDWHVVVLAMATIHLIIRYGPDTWARSSSNRSVAKYKGEIRRVKAKQLLAGFDSELTSNLYDVRSVNRPMETVSLLRR